MKNNKRIESVAIVSNGDDWEGLYINGNLVYENHQVANDTLASHLGYSLEEFSCVMPQDSAGLPKKLETVREYHHASRQLNTLRNRCFAAQSNISLAMRDGREVTASELAERDALEQELKTVHEIHQKLSLSFS